MAGKIELENEIKWLSQLLPRHRDSPRLSLWAQCSHALSKWHHLKKVQSSQCWFWSWVEARSQGCWLLEAGQMWNGLSTGDSAPLEPIPSLQLGEQQGAGFVLFSGAQSVAVCYIDSKRKRAPQAIARVPLVLLGFLSSTFRSWRPLRKRGPGKPGPQISWVSVFCGSWLDASSPFVKVGLWDVWL